MFINEDPITYEKAIQSKKWRNAISKELEAHEKIGTWSKSKLPAGVQAIDTKWVFKTKEDGTKKARLVAKGYQEKNEEYLYAPVARLSTMRMLLSLALSKDWLIKHLDVPTAFLNSKLKTNIYIKIPQGVIETETDVYKLNRALYGLKCAPRTWNETFDDFANENGFRRSRSDFCLYFKDKTIMLIYVDDIIITGEEIQEIVEKLKTQFNTKNLGEIKNFIGIKIERDENRIKLSQQTMIEKVLKIAGMEDCKGVKTPVEKDINIKDNGEIINVPFREIIGSLMYLSVCTRPDITFGVSYLSRFLDRPTEKLWTAAKRILRYLKQTKTHSLVYKKNESHKIVSYSDSDWGSDQTDRKSVSGCIVYYLGNPIFWFSRKQQCWIHCDGNLALTTASDG